MIINFILSVGLETYQILMSSVQDIPFPALCPISSSSESNRENEGGIQEKKKREKKK